MGLLEKTKALFTTKAAEGAYHEGPYSLPITGGWLPSGTPWNFWQSGIEPASGTGGALVEACVAAYSQTTAMCPGNHWRWTPNGGRTRVLASTSSLARVLRKPNGYQTISDLLLNMVRGLLLEGNAYALALRNNRNEITELHLMDPRQSQARLAYDGSIYYDLGGNPVIDKIFGHNLTVPARDVLHVRMQTPRHPLVGESPLVAAALQMSVGNAALAQQVQFFLNQSRPSFVLTTDAQLTSDQVAELRNRWNEQAKGLNSGGTPILTNGLKASPLAMNADDSELIEILKLSDQAVAHVFRVPMQILGIGQGATPNASTEALMQQWKAGGLGFLLNHIEEAMGLFFNLTGQPEEYLEFDTSALLRSNFKERVEAWVMGTKGGVFDRNAARADFEMAPTPFGDEPWVQQQDIPLSVAGETAKNPPVPAPVEPVNDNAAELEQARALLAIRKGFS